MSEYLKVEGYEDYVRDLNTGAIINTQKKPTKSFSSEFKTIQQDLNNLKNEISEIKSLLQKLSP